MGRAKLRKSRRRLVRQSAESVAACSGTKRRAAFWICAALLLATALVYVPQVSHFDFLSLDDPDDVAKNPYVVRGMTEASLSWALTYTGGYWYPATRISHMLDCELFGINSGAHHVMNVFYHALATLLLFAFLNRATHARWPSAFAACIFALHPLRVESVAWIAERKDVLTALFWFLSLWAYSRYVDRPTKGRYLLILSAFCCALMAKSTVVTLPFILLLLDIWPCRRLTPLNLTSSAIRRLVVEKIPFVVLSVTVATLTYLTQKAAGAIGGTEFSHVFPLGLRCKNALLSYLIYAGKTLWPTRLAAFYPFPFHIPIWQPIVGGIALLGLSVGSLILVRQYPYLTVGWFWYLATLVPVIAPFQTGDIVAAHADRYVYIPSVGLLIMIVWGVADLIRRWPRTKYFFLTVGFAACCSCAILTSSYLRYWNNTETLYNHSLAVTGDSAFVHSILGNHFCNGLFGTSRRTAEGIEHLRLACELAPYDVEICIQFGRVLLFAPGHTSEAIRQLQAALRLDPARARASGVFFHLAFAEAIAASERALEADSGNPMAHYKLGVVLMHVLGRESEGHDHLLTALKLNPALQANPVTVQVGDIRYTPVFRVNHE